MFVKRDVVCVVGGNTTTEAAIHVIRSGAHVGTAAAVEAVRPPAESFAEFIDEAVVVVREPEGVNGFEIPLGVPQPFVVDDDRRAIAERDVGNRLMIERA